MEFINSNKKNKNKKKRQYSVYGHLEYLNGFHNFGSANHVSLGAGLLICLIEVSNICIYH